MRINLRSVLAGTYCIQDDYFSDYYFYDDSGEMIIFEPTENCFCNTDRCTVTSENNGANSLASNWFILAAVTLLLITIPWCG